MPDVEKAKATRLVTLYSVVNGLLVPFTLFFGLFCYESRDIATGWACFRQPLFIVVVPALVCTAAALILYFTHKYNSAVVVAALPTVIAALWFAWLLLFRVL